MPRQRAIDPEILQAALAGLEVQRTSINDQVAVLRSFLGSGGRSPTPNGRRRRKYHISKEGRARIAAASRKRWAALKKAARAKKKAA
jgi:hypothetical protein